MSAAAQLQAPPLPPRPTSTPSPINPKKGLLQAPGEQKDSLFTFFRPPTPEEEEEARNVIPRESMKPQPLKSSSSKSSINSRDSNNTLYRAPSVEAPKQAHSATDKNQTSSVIDAARIRDSLHFKDGPLNHDTAEKQLGYSFDAEASLRDFVKPRAERNNTVNRKPAPSRPRRESNTTYNTGTAPGWRTVRLEAPVPSSTTITSQGQAPIAPPKPQKAFLHDAPELSPAEFLSQPLPEQFGTIQPPPNKLPTVMGAQQSVPPHLEADLHPSQEDVEKQEKAAKRGPCGMPKWLIVTLVALVAILAIVLFVVKMVQDFGKPRMNYNDDQS